MNYIYDIYLNFNDVIIDFFEWYKSDKISHIKKIPLIKISHDDFININSYSTKINEDLLDEIKNKTEVYNSNKIEFCALFCDDNNLVAIIFDNKGNSIKKSYLQIDEELEVLDTTYKYKLRNINYKILEKDKYMFKTRKEIRDDEFIEKELKNIEYEKLKYIYFECFNRHENNINIIINDIKKLSKSSKTYKNLYNILKLTSTQ